jgi:nucleoside-diphosphate-sugar epimerase
MKIHAAEKILITGASGFLAQATVVELKKSNHVVIPCYHRQANSSRDIVCDIGDPPELLKLLQDVQPNIIVNLAAHIGFNNEELEDLYPTNSLAPAIMADYCKKTDGKLIQASGSIVHGFQHSIYSLDTPLRPDNNYGKSKLIADEFIQASGCASAIIRFGGIFGLNGPSHLGINRAINNATKGIVPKLHGSGEGKRNYIFVEDAAKIVLHLIEQKSSGIFYAGGETLSLSTMLDQICGKLLPGKVVDKKSGPKVNDQIVMTSDELPETRKFVECLDICRKNLV